MMKNRNKIIVVGATGYIGRLLFEGASRVGSVIGTSSSAIGGLLQLRFDAAFNFDYEKIESGDVVFLAAAISAPDICAREYHRAWDINVTGTSLFISNVIARGGRVIFFSSDAVYGERKNSFDESVVSSPVGEYAVMKHEIEQRFVGNTSFKAIRLSYVFSHEDKFTKYLIGCAQSNEEAELFHPFYRAIVHRDDVVEGALGLAQNWDEFPQTIINFGGPEVLSRIDFADSLIEAGLSNLKYRVIEPEDDFFKNRPKVIAMSSGLLPRLLGRPSHRLADAARIEFSLS